MGKKLVLFWIFGSILIMVSSWILGNAERVFGAYVFSYYLAIFIAFVLMLAGGLAWITVASKVAKH